MGAVEESAAGEELALDCFSLGPYSAVQDNCGGERVLVVGVPGMLSLGRMVPRIRCERCLFVLEVPALPPCAQCPMDRRRRTAGHYHFPSTSWMRAMIRGSFAMPGAASCSTWDGLTQLAPRSARPADCSS